MALRAVHTFHYAAEACLALCVAFGAFALGGAVPWALWPIALLGWSAAALSLAGTWSAGRSPRWHAILWLPLAALALCLFQLVPLPPGVLGLLSPAAADLRNFALVPLGLDSWRPLSIEPSATWREVGKYATYASVLFVSLQLGRSSRARVRLLGMLASVGATVALIGLVHRLLGLDALFGVYNYSSPQHLLTTIGNANHLAAFLTVTGVASTGLAVSTDNRQKAAIWGLFGVIIAVAALLTLSRGGVGFFVIAHAVLGLVVVARRGSGWRGAAPVAIATSAIGLALYLVSDQLLDRLHTLDSVAKVQQSNPDLWPMFSDAAVAYARMGMGRGAFEVGFTRFQTKDLNVTFTHPENLVLQLAAEFGAPATVALIAIALGCAVGLLRSRKLGLLEYAALIGAVSIAMHDLFDFALELPATALAATVATGVAFSVTADAARRVRVSSAAAGLGGLLACLGAASIGAQHSLNDDERALRELVAQRPPIETLRGQAMLAIDRHPGDFLLYSMMAQASAARGEAWESLAWVNRILFLRPADASAHTAAAVALLRLGRRTQALGEFRLAFEGGDSLGMDLAVRSARSVDELERLTSDRVELLIEVSGRLRRSGRTADADAILVPHMVPDAPVELILHAAQVDAARGDHAAALALLEGAAQRAPDRPQLIAGTAAELAATGKYEEAVALLQTGLARLPDSSELGVALVQLHLAAARPAKAREVITRLLPFAPDAHARALLFQREAQAHAAEGHPALAIKSWQTVAQLEPNFAGHHYELARLQEQLGRIREARNSVSCGLAAAGPEAGAQEKAWLERLDQAIATRTGQQGRNGLEFLTDAGDNRP